MMRKTIAAAALVALLAACDSGSDDAADGRTAEGEVLGGTISDAMLPLDTVQSQSPPLRTAPSGEDGDEAVEGFDAEPPAESEADAEAGEVEPATPAPAPAPAETDASEGDGE